jgi:hypothetical protein
MVEVIRQCLLRAPSNSQGGGSGQVSGASFTMLTKGKSQLLQNFRSKNNTLEEKF